MDTDSLKNRFYDEANHPYELFGDLVARHVNKESVLLDAGCGRTAVVLRYFIGHVKKLIGVEMVEFTYENPELELISADLANVPLPDNSVDVIMSRSVFEHLTEPEKVYAELFRILKPGGKLIFLTANYWDYATQIARLVPNRYHSKVVHMVEGRAEHDVFPTAYKTNTPGAIHSLARATGFLVEDLQHLNQYPNYFNFSKILFLLGVAYERVTSRFSALKFLRSWLLVTLAKPR